MNGSVIMVVSILAIIIIFCLVKVLKGKKNVREQEDAIININDKNSNSAINTNRFEDREEYDKTVHLGTKTVMGSNSSGDKPNEAIVIEEIPILSKDDKTQILRNIEKQAKTELLINNRKGSNKATENTEIFVQKDTPKPKAQLKYMENGKQMEYKICTEFINIGRDPEICHLLISGDNFLGKHHAIIFNRNNKFYLVDISSKNGTYVGDEKVEGTVELKGSCKVKLAKTEVEFILL